MVFTKLVTTKATHETCYGDKQLNMTVSDLQKQDGKLVYNIVSGNQTRRKDNTVSMKEMDYSKCSNVVAISDL